MWIVRSPDGELKASSDYQIEMWVEQKRIAPSAQVFHQQLQRWVPAADLRSIREYLRFRDSIRTPFRGWCWSLLRHSSNGGLWGRLLAFAITPVALIAVTAGVFLFPPGIYPRIVLAAPGLAVVAVVLGFAAPVAFQLTSLFGPVINFVMPCPSCCTPLSITGPHHKQLRCPSCGAVVW